MKKLILSLILVLFSFVIYGQIEKKTITIYSKNGTPRQYEISIFDNGVGGYSLQVFDHQEAKLNQYDIRRMNEINRDWQIYDYQSNQFRNIDIWDHSSNNLLYEPYEADFTNIGNDLVQTGLQWLWYIRFYQGSSANRSSLPTEKEWSRILEERRRLMREKQRLADEKSHILRERQNNKIEQFKKEQLKREIEKEKRKIYENHAVKEFERFKSLDELLIKTRQEKRLIILYNALKKDFSDIPSEYDHFNKTLKEDSSAVRVIFNAVKEKIKQNNDTSQYYWPTQYWRLPSQYMRVFVDYFDASAIMPPSIEEFKEQLGFKKMPYEKADYRLGEIFLKERTKYSLEFIKLLFNQIYAYDLALRVAKTFLSPSNIEHCYNPVEIMQSLISYKKELKDIKNSLYLVNTNEEGKDKQFILDSLIIPGIDRANNTIEKYENIVMEK